MNATGTFTQVFTAANGCDSTVTLNFQVQPQITNSVSRTVCFGQTYTWGAQTLNTTGTFTQVFTAANGCDSTVTMNFLVQPQITHAVTATICNGTTYSFGSQLLSTTGIYTAVFPSSSGCDSTVTLSLNVNPSITNTANSTICNGTVYTWGAQALSTTGIYVQTFPGSGGCDSIVTLNLTVSPAIVKSITVAVCNGTSYAFGPQVLTASGSYSQVFPAANGCDSTVSLALTVKPAISTAVQAFICNNQSYTFGPQILTVAGTYNRTFTAADGCDSMVTLNLFISPAPAMATVDTAACGVVSFKGNQYFSNTTVLDTLLNTRGCDSIRRTINITVYNNVPVQRIIDTSGCGSVYFEGNTYTQATTLHHTYTSIHGCDSLERTIFIRVMQPQSDTTTLALCQGEGYDFHGSYYTSTGFYKASYNGTSGCDSSFILILRVNPLPVVAFETSDRTSFCIGDSIELSTNGLYDYRWTNEFNMDIGTGAFKKVYLHGYTNFFTVEATDANGCHDTASLSVKAQPCCSVWLPNAFSPNGDGLNDKFKPETNGHPKEYAMYIFNRWGAAVFSSFDITEGWDGTVNGKPADIATYYYRISGKCVNGEVLDKKGELTLIR